jgi:hypothetical protein
MINKRPSFAITEKEYKQQEIYEKLTVITQLLLIQYITHALMCNIRDPNASYCKTGFFQPQI